MRIIKYSFCAFLLSFLSLVSLIAQQKDQLENKSDTTQAYEEDHPFPSGAQMVFIGDRGNKPFVEKLGSCEENFWLGRYEFTVRDWYNCLLFAASDYDPNFTIDPHQLWNERMSPWIQRTQTYIYTIVPGTESYPITHVSFINACRACNIRHNLLKRGFIEEARTLTSLPKMKEVLKEGESIDTITEDGAYKITRYPGDKYGVELQKDALFYIPTRSQWTKAAYYKGGSLDAGYFLYPTRHDNNPGDRESSDFNNKANYNLYPLCSWAPALALSSVDSCGYLGSDGLLHGTCSSYGCFDMAGNVSEWTSTESDKTGNYIVMGGDYTSEYYMLQKNYLMLTCPPRDVDPTTTESDLIGFRMAAVEGAFDLSSSETPTLLADDYSWYNIPGQWNNLTTAEQTAIPVVATAAVVAPFALGYCTVGGVLGGISDGIASGCQFVTQTSSSCWTALKGAASSGYMKVAALFVASEAGVGAGAGGVGAGAGVVTGEGGVAAEGGGTVMVNSKEVVLATENVAPRASSNGGLRAWLLSWFGR